MNYLYFRKFSKASRPAALFKMSVHATFPSSLLIPSWVMMAPSLCFFKSVFGASLFPGGFSSDRVFRRPFILLHLMMISCCSQCYFFSWPISIHVRGFSAGDADEALRWTSKKHRVSGWVPALQPQISSLRYTIVVLLQRPPVCGLFVPPSHAVALPPPLWAVGLPPPYI